MKTAISIPDQIFKSAEKLAKKLGLSRSELFTKAVKNYIQRTDDDEITANLNQVYSVNDSTLDSGLARLQSKSIPKEKW